VFILCLAMFVYCTFAQQIFPSIKPSIATQVVPTDAARAVFRQGEHHTDHRRSGADDQCDAQHAAGLLCLRLVDAVELARRQLMQRTALQRVAGRADVHGDVRGEGGHAILDRVQCRHRLAEAHVEQAAPRAAALAQNALRLRESDGGPVGKRDEVFLEPVEVLPQVRHHIGLAANAN
jgi:hypothetical protein